MNKVILICIGDSVVNLFGDIGEWIMCVCLILCLVIVGDSVVGGVCRSGDD